MLELADIEAAIQEEDDLAEVMHIVRRLLHRKEDRKLSVDFSINAHNLDFSLQK